MTGRGFVGQDSIATESLHRRAAVFEFSWNRSILSSP
jgi:hypothetical protein